VLEEEKAGLRWDRGGNKIEHMYHLSLISSPFIQSLKNRKIKLKIKKIPTTFIQLLRAENIKNEKKTQKREGKRIILP
jgi:hypothetical protein